MTAQSLEHYNGRKIVLWGDYNDSYIIEGRLHTQHHIQVHFYIDSDINKQDGKNVFAPSVLENKSDEYYIIIPLLYHKEISDALRDYGYQKNIDYCYYCDCIVKQSEDYYEDERGNKIIGNYKGLRFQFLGFNTSIKIELGARFANTSIRMENDVTVSIGKNSLIMNMTIIAQSESVIDIGSKCAFFGGDRIFVRKNGVLCIGIHSSVQINCLY